MPTPSIPAATYRLQLNATFTFDAAIDIALTPGVRVRPPFEIRPTRGELREIQRRSRLHSDGEVTISVALAESVARGEISLQDAVAHQRRRDRSSED